MKTHLLPSEQPEYFKKCCYYCLWFVCPVLSWIVPMESTIDYGDKITVAFLFSLACRLYCLDISSLFSMVKLVNYNFV